MKKILLATVALGALSLFNVAPASAGCVTGAIVGGIAGHLVGHGGLGAAAGCAYGVHKNHQTREITILTCSRAARAMMAIGAVIQTDIELTK